MTPQQANDVWERMVRAEVRSGYFADLASRYTKQKQWISGISLLLASSGFASFWADSPGVAPWLALIVAIAHAYSMASGLDKKAITMARLHVSWSRLAADYNHLWHHWYEVDADRVYADLLARARDLSETATTEAPRDEKLLDKWTDEVYALYSPAR